MRGAIFFPFCPVYLSTPDCFSDWNPAWGCSSEVECLSSVQPVWVGCPARHNKKAIKDNALTGEGERKKKRKTPATLSEDLRGAWRGKERHFYLPEM